jgi:D-sedoheptulose 7-phosphate isomerase
MHHLATMFKDTGTVQEYTKAYFERLTQVLSSLDLDAVTKAVEAIEQASQNKKALYTIANGGSAAAASHLVNDLVAGAYTEGQPGFRSYCLTDNSESITALANDAGFENIFSHQLKTNLLEGDVVLAMSVSGNSENIIRAMEYANANGATTIGCCGFDGGRLAKCSDIVIHAPTTPDEYGPVEDVFAILVHVFGTYLAMQRGRWLHH